MTTDIDGTTDDTTQEGAGSEGTSDQTASQAPDPLALARKRQAGAEAARQEAARQLSEAQKRLEAYEAKERTEDQTKAADMATLQERLAAAEARAAEADAKAEARILDIKYPNARARLPEITDEVRLAEFEAILADPAAEPPTPQNPNVSNRSASADATVGKPKEETSEDILARLKSMGRPDWL